MGEVLVEAVRDVVESVPGEVPEQEIRCCNRDIIRLINIKMLKAGRKNLRHPSRHVGKGEIDRFYHSVKRLPFKIILKYFCRLVVSGVRPSIRP